MKLFLNLQDYEVSLPYDDSAPTPKMNRPINMNANCAVRFTELRNEGTNATRPVKKIKRNQTKK